MHKRAQLTVFVILGLLVVITVGSVLYLNAQRSRPIAGLPQVEQVAEAVQPIQDYVHQCLRMISREGLQQLGDHGGYLSTRDAKGIAINPTEPTESDALIFAPDSQYAVPYWWYMKSKNTCAGDCAFASKRPNLYKSQGEPSIEGQMEQYVARALDGCLKQFGPFTQQGFTVTSKDLGNVQAYVTPDDVVVGLRREFTAKRADETHKLSDFAVHVPVRMKDLYDLATNITVLEAENAFLAKHARELISINARTDPQALPPTGTVEFEMSPGTVWVKATVVERLQGLLQNYVPLLQVFGTRNYRPLEVPASVENTGTVESALNRNALIPMLKAFPDIEARFSYIDAWKPYVDLDCKGQVCKPESFLNSIGLVFGIQRYDFAYDLSYPVLVELREPGAYDGTGFAFRFALEGNLRNNEPVTADWEELIRNPPTAQESQLCNDNQRTSGYMNLTLTDSFTGRGVDAAVTYRCGGEGCILGSAVGGKLSTRLPRCIGGQLSVYQVDYAPRGARLNSNTDDDQVLDLVMHPIVELEANVVKYRTIKDRVTGDWRLGDSAIPFTPLDQALITLQRDTRGDEETYSSFASVCGGSLTRGIVDRKLQLTPGNYTITITTLYHGDITVPSDRRCYKIKKLFGSDKKCFNVPEKPIYFGNSTGKPCVSEKPFPSGSISYVWEFTPEMLRDGKKITFTAITMAAELLEPVVGPPNSYLVVEDLEQISKTQDFAESYAGLFWPRVTP